jgi:hypothetical protein
MLKVGTAIPTPLTDAFCNPPVALSDTLTVAVSLTALEGVKVTLITQLLPAASVVGGSGHVFVCTKSPTFVPTSAMLFSIIPALPVFLNVIACAALAVPTAWLANVSVEGDKLARGPLLKTLVPVPTSITVCVPPLALSEMIANALSPLIVEGLNVKLMVQVPPTARVPGDIGQLLVWVKSLLFVPVTAMLLILSPAFPGFANVRV